MAEIISLDNLQNKIEFLRSKNPKLIVVATNGCFDILHVGHIRSLQKAKSLGDVLVVGLNSDESVERLKGKNRPIINEIERAEVLASLACIDIVSIFKEKTAEKFLKLVKPNIYVKGEEYGIDNLPEAKVVNQLGGTIIQIPMISGISTTKIIEKLKKI